LAILLLIVLVVYLILSIGAIRNETEEMWQEIALMQAESGHGIPDDRYEPDSDE